MLSYPFRLGTLFPYRRYIAKEMNLLVDFLTIARIYHLALGLLASSDNTEGEKKILSIHVEFKMKIIPLKFFVFHQIIRQASHENKKYIKYIRSLFICIIFNNWKIETNSEYINNIFEIRAKHYFHGGYIYEISIKKH